MKFLIPVIAVACFANAVVGRSIAITEDVESPCKFAKLAIVLACCHHLEVTARTHVTINYYV
jgi:hypothetical protein